MNRRPIFDSRGQDTGATFGVEPRGRALTIRFDSRGTTAGTRAYRAGLVLLLTRLADLGAEISDVAVDSLTVKNLSRADRRLKLSGRKYPLAFPRRGGGVGPDVVAHEVEALRKSFHTAAASVSSPSRVPRNAPSTASTTRGQSSVLNSPRRWPKRSWVPPSRIS